VSGAPGGPAFVAGATGYVGREVVRLLAQRGDSVRGPAVVAHVRVDSPRLAEWRARFAAMGAAADATPWDEAALTDTLRRLRPATVYALLGTTRARRREAARRGARETYESVDYGLTALLLHAARRAAADTGVTPRFVYLSALGVGPGSRNPYVAVRWRMEEELRASGVPFTIARPGFVTGPDREESRPLERVAAAVADALLGVAARLGARGLRDRWGSITGRDLAAALVRLAADPAAAGRVVKGAGLR
jgi:nucleoside-diphosphate-sugar epimerase